MTPRSGSSPAGWSPAPRDQVVKVNKQGLDRVLGFLNTFLLVFAAISLVVGTFLIVNTFSILVAAAQPRAGAAPRARGVPAAGQRLGHHRRR